MLFGTYEHNIDGKNRIFVPASFRAVLGDEYIYRYCPSKRFPKIQLYSREFYERNAPVATGIVIERADQIASTVNFFGTGEATCDSQGRIIINPRIAKKAGLTKECVIIGCGVYAEIMSADVYDRFLDSLDEKSDDADLAHDSETKVKNSLIAQGAYVDRGNLSGNEGE